MAKQNIDLQIAMIEKDISQLTNNSNKFEETIKNLCDAANSLKEVVAIQETRINLRDKIDKEMLNLVEKHRNETLEFNTALTAMYEKSMDQHIRDISSLEEKIFLVEKTFIEKISSVQFKIYALFGGWTVLISLLSQIKLSNLF